jgi:hypothetical protein
MIASQMIVNTFALVLLNCTIAAFGFIILDVHVPAGDGIHVALLIVFTAYSALCIELLITSVFGTYFGVTHVAFGVCLAFCLNSGNIRSIL